MIGWIFVIVGQVKNMLASRTFTFYGPHVARGPRAADARLFELGRFKFFFVKEAKIIIYLKKTNCFTTLLVIKKRYIFLQDF